MPERALRVALATVLLLSGIKLLDFSWANWLIAGGAAAGLVALAAWALAGRVGRRPRPEAAS
jgi:hypothetical protein